MTVGQSPTCSFSVSDGREVLFLSPFRAVLGAIHVQVTDRPSPDAPSLTQANNCANGLFPEKAHFLSRPIPLVWIIAKAIELPGDRQKWREIHRCVLMQQHLQRRLLVSRLRRSWHLESVVRNGENELVLCFVSMPYILSPASSFLPRFRLCSFFYLFSHLAPLISSYVQYDDGAHKAERSSNASELRAVRQAIQGMTTKLLLFPKLKTVWFSCVVVLRLVPVLAGKDPVKVG